MAIVFAFSSLAVPVALGFFIVSLRWPAAFRSATLPLRIFLGVGAGMGVVSSAYSVWYFAFGRPGIGYYAIETSGLVLVSAWYLRQTMRLSVSLTAMVTRSLVSNWLRASWWLVAIFSGLTYMLLAVKYTHGTWDAWAIWNLRARFFFSDAGLGMTFSPLLSWSHVDYPLLLPGLVARTWQQLGVATPVVPMLVAALFTTATVGLLATALTVLRQRSAGLLASLLLLGTPAFLAYGSYQVADIPLAYFMLAAVALLLLAHASASHHLMFLADGMAGMAAWTKNEGVLFLVVLGGLLALGRLLPWRQWQRWMFGATPWLVLIAYFKIRWAPPNDLIALPVLQQTIGQLWQADRYWFLLRAFAREVVLFGGWRISLVVVLASYLLVNFAAKHPSVENRLARGMQVLVGLMLVAYWVILLLDPRDLAWHVGSALNRLFLQLWPTTLLLVFLQSRFSWGKPQTIK